MHYKCPVVNLCQNQKMIRSTKQKQVEKYDMKDTLINCDEAKVLPRSQGWYNVTPFHDFSGVFIKETRHRLLPEGK